MACFNQRYYVNGSVRVLSNYLILTKSLNYCLASCIIDNIKWYSVDHSISGNTHSVFMLIYVFMLIRAPVMYI